ncbi:MFS transporter [Kitasatospora sp. NBC_01287]|uniref:MFS transporter n=1 Tax=Kitasatospora sp. NBC_01287 TaxID=2903573 RepID=UPI0022545D6F|nr:MFS transporter [Kitasatospora sp. NBC_01287]MCX4747928.1 MFS transporter [Kitasatospora sp. NBC_01287]
MVNIPLRRNRRFQLLWAGSAAALLGTRIADTAYPLLLLATTGSPVLAGAFASVEFTAALLCGPHAGAVADRYDRRRILLLAETVRLLAAAGVVVALALGHFTFGQAVLVAAATGAASAYAGPSRMLAVRSVVPAAQLRQALAQEELRGSSTSLLGPPLAGLLFAAGRPLPILGTALGSLLSLAAVRAALPRTPAARAAAPAAPDPDADPGHQPGPLPPATTPLRLLFGSPLLRATLGAAIPLNLVGSGMTLVVLVLLRSRGADGTTVGLTLAGEAAGAIGGAFLVGRLHRLAGPGRLLLGAAWLCVPLLLVLLLPGGPVVVFLALAAMNLALPALRVMIDVLIFQQVPDGLRGRVIAITLTTVMLGVPLGSMLAGLLLDLLSPGSALVVFAALLALGLLPSTAGRALWTARWPTAPAAPATVPARAA